MNHYSITPEDRQAAAEPPKSEIIPEGVYTAVIVKAEELPTKTQTDGAPNGFGPNLELVVDEGEHKGKRIWDHLLLEHVKAQTQGIARRNYTALCLSIGYPEGIGQLSDLCFKRFEVAIKVEPANGQYPPRNRVHFYVLPESAKAAPKAKVAPAPQATGDWLHEAPDGSGEEAPF